MLEYLSHLCPVVVALNDIHWVNPTSELCLAWIVGGLPTTPAFTLSAQAL